MTDFISIQYYQCPVGELIIGVNNHEIVLCDWRYRKQRTNIDKRIQKHLNKSYKEEKNELIDLLIQQLESYFKSERTNFDLPLLFLGTPFQCKVWKKLQEIPYGETQSYLELARQLGNEKSIRAVASANGANALSIIVPCHRIIGSDGSLIGYAGGLHAKQKLLELEGAFSNDQLNLFQ